MAKNFASRLREKNGQIKKIRAQVRKLRAKNRELKLKIAGRWGFSPYDWGNRRYGKENYPDIKNCR